MKVVITVDVFQYADGRSAEMTQQYSVATI